MIDLKQIKKFTPLCFSCLGRAFGRVGFGLDNRERGMEILNQIENHENSNLEDVLICESLECRVCDGLIHDVDNFVDIVSQAMTKYSVSNFKIGTIVDTDILEFESEFQSFCGSEFGESIKSQLNREIGIGVCSKLSIDVSMDLPDAVAIVDTRYDTVELEIKSLFIEGNYNKYDRSLPQTHWPCSRCRGQGCIKCDNTGQLYPESVQSLIAKPFVSASISESDLFHGMGREDIDAAMLGEGRPFVLELRRPQRRDINLASLSKLVNDSNSHRIKISKLHWVSRPRVAELKNTSCEKTYRVDVSISSEITIESLKKGAQALTNKVIEQRTPLRVAHRRADLVRPRLVHSMTVKSFEDGKGELEIKAQHGTYIRELVSGDQGRTVPSLSLLVGFPCKVEVLDVLRLHLATSEDKNV